VVPGCYAYLLVCVLSSCPCGLYIEMECQFICEALSSDSEDRIFMFAASLRKV
jgi:hypothetical protein